MEKAAIQRCGEMIAARLTVEYLNQIEAGSRRVVAGPVKDEWGVEDMGPNKASRDIFLCKSNQS